MQNIILDGFLNYIKSKLNEEGEGGSVTSSVANTTDNLPGVPVISANNSYKNKNKRDARLGLVRRKKPL
jgi:hypothetical protein